MLTASHAECPVDSALCLLFQTLSRLNKVRQLIKEMAKGGTGQLIFFHVLMFVCYDRGPKLRGPRGKRPFVVQKGVAGLR